MSFAYRSSAPNLDHYDDPPRRPERWDRERFERARSRGPPEERESFRFSEREREREAPRARRDVAVLEEKRESRGPRSRFEEDDFFEEDHFERERRPGRRPAFLDREEPTPSEVANRALAPYRRRTVVERGHSPPVRRPVRPGVIRRQSSLDTFDRRPRYEEREEWRPPTNVDIPLPIRRRPSPVRRRSPPRDRYREEDFEEIRYRDAEPEFREYRDVEVRREKSRISRRRSPRKSETFSAPSRSSSSSFEEIREVSPAQLPGKRGKTRMPKRLVNRNAIVQLGYPFDEEENFYVVKRALEKDHIDEIIKISESYKQEGGRTTYRYEEQAVEQPPPPPLELAPPPPPPSIPEPLPPPPPPVSVHGGHSVRTVSPPRREFIEEREEISNHIGGPFTVVVPDRHRRSDRDINEEIVRLENERRALRLEREAQEIREIGYRETDRESEYEIVEERRPERNVVRVDKDRKARARSRSKRRRDPKLVAAMMSTLT